MPGEGTAPEGPGRGPARHEPARRLFFAFWPDEAMREAMVRATRKAARASGGRPIPASNLHVTLAFLGSVPERRLPELAEAARAAALCPALANAGEPGSHRGAAAGERTGSPGGHPGAAGESAGSPEDRVEIAFDHLEHWRAAQLLCALPAEPSAPAAALARGLQDQLAARGFSPDLKPFRPHVTVVRKLLRPGRIEPMHPVVWSFTDLALIESCTLPAGALYSVVESYPLCSDQKTANNSEMP